MSDKLVPISVAALLDFEEVPGADRYEFSLFNRNGERVDFIVDVPADTVDRKFVDVWVVNSVVDIGDAPEDSFATYELLSED